MIRIIIPLIFVLAAGGVYFFLTDPLISNPLVVDAQSQNIDGGIKVLREEKKSLEEAITTIQTLQGRARQLEEVYSRIDPRLRERLERFLPDSVDDIQLIVDVENLARKSGMSLRNIKVTADNQTNNRQQIDTNRPQVARVTLAFSVNGSYSQLRSFLQDVTRSLRVLDIKKLSFSSVEAAEGGSGYQYNIELVTYWLK